MCRGLNWLEQAVAKNRVADAYLFAGPRGSGKTTTARLVAKALNCERRKPGESEPCNECGSCVAITNGTSLDVLEIDGASNRGIEEIRNLRENVKYSASGGKFKVYIIDEAHQLTDFAWNALLKTLEEPPEHVRFVFCTTEPLEVPDTIASRCQVFEFRRLRSEELGLAGLDAYFDLGDALAKRDPKLALQVLDRLHDRGMDVEEIADGLSHHLRQLLMIAVDASLEKLVDAAPSDRERYAAQAKEFKPTDLNAMLNLLLDTRALLRRAEAPRILLEVALVEMCTLPTAARIEDLIRRLGELESKLGGGTGGSGGSAGSGTAAAPRPSSQEPAAPPATPARRPSSTPRAIADTESPRSALTAVAAAPGAEPLPPSFGSPADLRLVGPPAAVEMADPSDPVVRWRSAVDRVKERKLLLGTCLEEGAFLGLAGTNVRIALSVEHAFHRAMLEMKENREILNEELERTYGRGAKLLCESAIPPGLETQDAGRREAKTAPAPGGNPEGTLVERIVELFDGEVLGHGPDEG